MGYAKDREYFLVQFARNFPTAPLSVARSMLRCGTSEQVWNETVSSIDIGERATKRGEDKSHRRAARMRLMAAQIGAELDDQGDPRGNPYVLKFMRNGCSTTLDVPGRGLPARCFQ